MRSSRRNTGVAFVATSFALGAIACSLVTSTDGLTDAGANVTDAQSDVVPTNDGTGPGADAVNGGDANTTACSGEGPSGVRVKLGAAAFCIDSTEVTRAQYAKFLASLPGATHARCAWNASFIPKREWPIVAGQENFPVVGVTWCDAFEYCKWAGKRLCGKIGGGPLSLASADTPVLSEMVFACSEGGQREYPYGGTYDPGACNGAGYGVGGPIAVGSAPKCEGGFPGIFDLSGNVEEWIDACDNAGDADGGPGRDTCAVLNSPWYEDEDIDLVCTRVRAAARGEVDGAIGFRCCGD